MKTFDFWFMASAIPVTFVVMLLWHRRQPYRLTEVAVFIAASLLLPELPYWILAMWDPTQLFQLGDIYFLRELTFVSEFVVVGYGAACFYFFLLIFDRQPRLEE